ncbi:HNH homing endonuclease [Enterococcus phage IME-EFm1]|uniref:HNH homing endonuclease n=1 Tax=Enterococcus phage IME-EFm1 TaxID=1445858 RepID=A0A060ANK4_9CAUD|nr:HNH homing endonuclease [Enterococcus phage IME-EFm1]AIA65113.1 HNH homing endonuclease [Enterococcus phage IME-EFm1]
MEEIWKDVKGYEGLYQVSNLGNFRKTNKCNATKLGYSIGKNGYKKVSLSNDKTRLTKYLHRLVAETFIPNPENKPTVDHVNRDRLDNRVENLRWATYSEQRSNQTSGETRIYATEIATGNKTIFESQNDCARKLGLPQSNINRCLKNRRKTLGGYTFEYAK